MFPRRRAKILISGRDARISLIAHSPGLSRINLSPLWTCNEARQMVPEDKCGEFFCFTHAFVMTRVAIPTRARHPETQLEARPAPRLFNNRLRTYTCPHPILMMSMSSRTLLSRSLDLLPTMSPTSVAFSLHVPSINSFSQQARATPLTPDPLTLPVDTPNAAIMVRYHFYHGRRMLSPQAIC